MLNIKQQDQLRTGEKMTNVIKCNKCQKMIEQDTECFKLSINKTGGGGMLSNFSLMPQASKHLCAKCNIWLEGILR